MMVNNSRICGVNRTCNLTFAWPRRIVIRRFSTPASASSFSRPFPQKSGFRFDLVLTPPVRKLTTRVTMASSYDIQTWLLDRANIHDTVTRLTFHIDTKSVEGLINEVYAPNLVLDYTSMFGGEPQETTGNEWSQKVGSMMTRYDETHHVVTGLLIQLPQPTNQAGRPDKCTVISNVTAHMVRRNAKGGPIVHDGGRYILDLIRLPELEEKGENPWRISKQTFTASWYDGNMEVLNTSGSEKTSKEDKN